VSYDPLTTKKNRQWTAEAPVWHCLWKHRYFFFLASRKKRIKKNIPPPTFSSSFTTLCIFHIRWTLSIPAVLHDFSCIVWVHYSTRERNSRMATKDVVLLRMGRFKLRALSRHPLRILPSWTLISARFESTEGQRECRTNKYKKRRKHPVRGKKKKTFFLSQRRVEKTQSF